MARERKHPRRKRHEPPPGAKSPATNRAFLAFLALHPLDHQEVAAAFGMEPEILQGYLSGKKILSLAEYRRLFKAIEAEATGEWLLALVAYLDKDDDAPTREEIKAGAEIHREGQRLAVTLSVRREVLAKKARQEALDRWELLQKMEPGHWRLVASAASELQCSAFVTVVGEESVRVAATDAGRALELANFALWVAERVPGDEGWSTRVFAWEALGNARRAGGDLAGAAEALACSARLQRSGKLPDLLMKATRSAH